MRLEEIFVPVLGQESHQLFVGPGEGMGSMCEGLLSHWPRVNSLSSTLPFHPLASWPCALPLVDALEWWAPEEDHPLLALPLAV